MTAAPSPTRLADGYHALVAGERLAHRAGGRLFGADDGWLRFFFYSHLNPAIRTVEFLGHYDVIVDLIARTEHLKGDQIPKVQPELGTVTFVIDRITIVADVNACTIAVTTNGIPADLPSYLRPYFQLRRLP